MEGLEVIEFLAILLCFVVIIPITILVYAARWIFYKKCKEEGWKAIIPFYNQYVLVQISGLNWWWVLFLYANVILGFISGFNSSLSQNIDSIALDIFSVIISLLTMVGSLIILAASFNVNYNISKKFNKNVGYAVLLTFFPTIMYLIMGLSKEFVYDENAPVTPNGIIDSMKSNKTTQEDKYCSKCGNKVNANADFCPKCGTKL